VKLVMAGFQMPSCRVSVPPLGLRSSRTSLSVDSERYKAACKVVAQELRAHGYNEQSVSDIQRKLEADPVMELASVRPCCCPCSRSPNTMRSQGKCRLLVLAIVVDGFLKYRGKVAGRCTE
jgi:hypothetical protein